MLSVWRNILTHIDRVNKGLQRKGVTVSQASKMINGLQNILQEMRDGDSDMNNTFTECKNTAESIEMPAEFTESRKRKVKRLQLYECEDESSSLSAEQSFKVQLKNVFDILMVELKWRYESLHQIASDFDFLSGDSLVKMDTTGLQKAAMALSLKYKSDLNASEISSEIQSFKHQALVLFPNVSCATSLNLLQLLHEYNLAESYPNLEIALRLFLCLPVTVASCERSFSKLKLIKNYLRASTGQERLTNMSILSIENEIANNINFDAIIDQFASLKARKIQF